MITRLWIRKANAFLYARFARIMKQLLKDFLFDIVKQLFWVSKPRPGKLILTRHAHEKMQEHQLTVETIKDAFRYGEAKEKDGKFIITRKYTFTTVGMYYKHDLATDKYVITTCWKGGE
jgi:DNA modification methylase